MGIFCAIVEPTATLLTLTDSNDPQCRTERAKPVGYDRSRSAVTFHGALQEFQRGQEIPALRRKNLKHLAFVIYRTPEIMRLTIDPDEHLVEVPAPLWKRPMMNASFPDRGGERWTEPVPPVPNRLMADIDTALEQEIFYLCMANS